MVVLAMLMIGLYPNTKCNPKQMVKGMSNAITKGMKIMLVLSFVPLVVAPNPNQQKDYDVLPGMEKWNGIPFHDFALTWWIALGVALGSIAQDGWTLMQTAQGVDQG